MSGVSSSQITFAIGFFVFATWIGTSLSGCQREVWDSNPDHALRFSTDTLFFDTVFATVGSITLPLKVYNDFDGTLLIDEIELESGLVSQYRINVNGEPLTNSGQPLRDVPLQPGDSLYLFVEVTVDPNESAGSVPFGSLKTCDFPPTAMTNLSN